jgi:hypothetical protein
MEIIKAPKTPDETNLSEKPEEIIEETEEEREKRLADNLKDLQESERKLREKQWEEYEKGKKDGSWIWPPPRERTDQIPEDGISS